MKYEIINTCVRDKIWKPDIIEKDSRSPDIIATAHTKFLLKESLNSTQEVLLNILN